MIVLVHDLMPRAKQYDRDALLIHAMERFWERGYYATSIDDLVATTGVSRHGLYAEFGDKRGLFLAVLQTYADIVVSPAFRQVEAPGANLTDVRSYFDTQIALAVAKGLPGPGCLVANTMTESAAHEPAFAAPVRRHLARLDSGFANALAGAASAPGVTPEIVGLARALTISAQGLWSVSRITADPAPLAAYVDHLLRAVEEGLPR